MLCCAPAKAPTVLALDLLTDSGCFQARDTVSGIAGLLFFTPVNRLVMVRCRRAYPAQNAAARCGLVAFRYII